ncbi:MAG TPA: TM2 domain-containing protein [Ktedonobacteraceae bacterium]|jgi:TM2 domain-containing membrane protein YozV|nr:TM2 domain-containing protein [Ktedonobacteraceae bacterium]
MMGNFQSYDPREPQQQQAQWQAPSPQQQEWQARPYSAPPQYGQYPGQVPLVAMEPQKSWLATVLLCQFLGHLGIHRFYTGRIVSGIFQLLTLGGFGIWTLIDLIMILSGDFKDQYNRPLYHPPVTGGTRNWTTTAFLCLFLGWLGIHRFYTGHVISGIFQLLTFGGFGIWTLIDLILIYTDSFKDDMGLLLTRAERVGANAYMYPGQVKG